MTLTPLDDKLVFEPVVIEVYNVGGIIILDTSKETPNIGTIISIGDGLRLDKLCIGDNIIYTTQNITKIEVDNKRYVIAPRCNIIAIVS